MLRSACDWARSEAWKPGFWKSAPWKLGRPITNYISTTSPWRAADSGEPTAVADRLPNGAAKPVPEGVIGGFPKTLSNARRKRAEAYVRQISGMLPDKSAATQQPWLEPAATDKKLVLDVKSMPRSPGGLRSLGGLGPGGRLGAARLRGLLNRRRGALRGGARGGARGGRAKGATGKEGEANPSGGRQQPQDIWTKVGPVARAFDEALRFGQPTQFEPQSTEALAADLADLIPPTPSSSAGRRAAVLSSLSRLAGTAGDAPGVPRDLPPAAYAEELECGGLCFFADLGTRDAVEAYLREKRRAQDSSAEPPRGDGATPSAPARIINLPDESIRRAIVDGALEGRHEAPRFATDPVGLARAWHLRSETYGPGQVESFEKKLQSLLSRAGVRNGIRSAAHPAARKAA